MPPDALLLDRNALDHALIDSGVRTLAGLARATGLCRASIGSIAAGRIPPPRTRAKIARVLRVREDDLWALVVAAGESPTRAA